MMDVVSFVVCKIVSMGMFFTFLMVHRLFCFVLFFSEKHRLIWTGSPWIHITLEIGVTINKGRHSSSTNFIARFIRF